MKIYLIRHGETELNAAGIKQGRDGLLSKRGKEQVASAALQMKNIPIDKIICSPYERTKETARILVSVISAPIEYSELFEERKNPTEIIGIDKHSEETKKVLKLIQENANNASWHYSDEENFYDLVNRSRKTLEFLKDNPSENVLVVSHAYFIGTLLLFVLLGDKLTPDIFYDIRRRLPITNAGVSEIELVERDGKKNWRVVTINNHRHLLEGNLLFQNLE